MKVKSFIVCLLFSITGLGQTIKERKAVQVMAPQNIYLNGGNNATFSGGKSRTWVPITLPPNTVEWYYSFSSSEGKSPQAAINLFAQLTRVVDPSGSTAIVVSLIMAPSGTAYCDAQLMDRKNADAFLEKVDHWGGTYRYYPSGSRDNFKQGAVQVKDITSGTWCLGFRNPSLTQGISITFEVVAIVEETKMIAKTEVQQKAELFGSMGWNAYLKGDLDQSLEWSKKAIALDSTLGWVNNNMGLVLLIKKEHDLAIDSYSKAIVNYKKSTDPKGHFAEAIQDMNNLIRMYGQVDGSKEILELLVREYDSY